MDIKEIDNIITNIATKVDETNRNELIQVIQFLMKVAAQETKKELTDLIESFYKLPGDKKDKIHYHKLPYGLEDIKQPDSTKNTTEILLEVFKENPRAQNSTHYLDKALKERGLKIIKT